ncbi:hypothetical protein [Sulfurisphaera tokodaii]|uniref:Uncharacterized protein n=2 Tax=Sulfurisphaera tokodaii TaxID=111955 RepID=Q976R2_SULTO|nr:hypothetical protein [Sulfurisphaera tokodaii]BAB65084.1 hypothetical protein STK_01290 [Sulfurisphaera tokodaii str. 7]HII74119.1 hypothetical protein [Sulfurisphaera tokodaii]
MELENIRRLVNFCYDKAHDPVTIRRCISSLFFEIILFIADRFPCRKDELFRNQNGVYNGLSEIRFIGSLMSLLESSNKFSLYEIDDFVKFLRLIALYRTLLDHFGGFKKELIKKNFHKIRTFEGEIDVSTINIPNELSRYELINILIEVERWLEFLRRLST